MNILFKSIFEWIVDQYSLFENPLYNWIVFGIIGLIGFAVAWNVVGSLYRNGDITGRTIGSLIHWIIRLLVMTALYLVIAFIIWIVKLAISIPWWVWIIIIVSLIGFATGTILLKQRMQKSKEIK